MKQLLEQLEQAVLSAVAEAISAAPSDQPAESVAYALFNSNRELAARLGQDLVIRYYTKLIRRERRTQRDHRQLPLPGFEHLPLRIPIKGHRPTDLFLASYSQVKAYYWFLRRKQTERGRNNPKVVETARLMELMQKHRGDRPTITVKEALALETKSIYG